MKKKIALFGGSFDPITKSHFAIAKECLKYVNQVWFFPCYFSYYDKKMASPKNRVKMITLALKNYGEPKIKLCDFEIKYKLMNETFEIMKLFFKDYGNPNVQFYFIIGSDNAKKINTWTNWDKLINMMPFIIISRPDHNENISKPDHNENIFKPNHNKNIVISKKRGKKKDEKDWYLKYPHKFLNLDLGTYNNGSSTDVRRLAEKGQQSIYVDDTVYNYIKAKQIYK